MAEQQVNEPRMNVEQATEILPIIISDDTTPGDVLLKFKECLPDIQKSGIEEGKLAKNILMQFVVSGQMEKQRYFEVVSPFDESCISCKGTGEIYKFERKTVKVNCHICAGKKKVTVKCRSCKGTGRFEKRWQGGGGISVTCKTCKGKGSVRVKCSNCRGKGKIKKVVPSHKIKSTTPCKHCDELGFIHPKPKKVHTKKSTHKKHYKSHVDNPVISAEAAKNLSQTLRASL